MTPPPPRSAEVTGAPQPDTFSSDTIAQEKFDGTDKINRITRGKLIKDRNENNTQPGRLNIKNMENKHNNRDSTGRLSSSEIYAARTIKNKSIHAARTNIHKKSYNKKRRKHKIDHTRKKIQRRLRKRVKRSQV